MDALRGAALAGMVAYHLAWDLHAYGFDAVDPSRSGGWRLLGHMVAGTFLALSGVGLELARRRGTTALATGGRLLRIAAAAALVTLVTHATSPEATIVFGILHCIVVTNLIALGLRPLRSGVLAGLAAVAMLAPAVVHVGWAGAWTGLAGVEPGTLDFRPVLPWLGPVLLGLVAARSRVVPWLAALRLRGAPMRVAAWAGRHSLAIYLLHQPVLLAVLIPLAAPRPAADLPRTPGEAAAFLRECRTACVKADGDDAVCVATCHCVLTGASARAAARLPNNHALQDAVAACRRAEE